MIFDQIARQEALDRARLLTRILGRKYVVRYNGLKYIVVPLEIS